MFQFTDINHFLLITQEGIVMRQVGALIFVPMMNRFAFIRVNVIFQFKILGEFVLIKITVLLPDGCY